MEKEARWVLLESDLLCQGSKLRCSFSKPNKSQNDWEQEEEKEEILLPEQRPPEKTSLWGTVWGEERRSPGYSLENKPEERVAQ